METTEPLTRRRKRDIPPERLPPHSIEAEQGVLGCILNQPDACMDICQDKLRGKLESFYDLKHREVYRAMAHLWHKERYFDTITLQQHLKDIGKLDEIGLSYLLELPDKSPSAANLSYYLKIVDEKYQLRKMIHLGGDIIDRAYGHNGELDELVWGVKSDIANVLDADTKSKCERYKVSELDEFDLDNDEDNLVGRRYVTRGSSLIINGASGRGKSSLLMMRIILWALGRPFYGQKVVRPLSAVIYQTENNKGDLAKAFQGARNFLEINSFEHEKEFALLEKNIEFVYCPALCGEEFLQFAESDLTRHPRDLAVLDPLVSFPEGDLNSREGAAEFLRKGLSRISFATGVTWVINHHTPKPLRDPKNTKARKNLSDYQYSGAGSFDIPGWARAVETLEEASDGVFRLVMAKRGTESGACHPDGTPTGILWLRHAYSGGIHWEQIDPPEEPEPQEKSSTPKGGQPSKVQKLLGLGLGPLLDTITEPIGKLELARRINDYAASKGMDVSLDTCKRTVEKLVENKAIKKQNDCYVK